MGQNVLSQSDCRIFLINHISRNKSMKWPDFLLVDTNLHKLKVDQEIFGWAWSEMGVASLVTGL